MGIGLLTAVSSMGTKLAPNRHYVQLLLDSFNVSAAQGVMCRDTVSVGWAGRIYDCDFNQQLALGMQ